MIQGAEELARNYDIDGLHMDDYFYPGQDFDDAAAFQQYGGDFSDLGDWRRDNVNQLVKELGERLHAIDPSLFLWHQSGRRMGQPEQPPRRFGYQWQ